jgi:regulator of sigma E protease
MENTTKKKSLWFRAEMIMVVIIGLVIYKFGLNGLYVGAAVVLLFGAAVFVHEWGHYYVARKRGLKVEAFAIGFGPKLFGWTRDGIEYSWRLIPAGGYVKLPQMVTSSAIEGSSEGVEAIPPAKPLSKILVAFAGPLMNVVFAFAIAGVIYFVGLPRLINPSVVGFIEPNSEEEKAGLKEGDRIVEVNGKPVDSWEKVQMETIFAQTNFIPVVYERAGARTQIHLTAKKNELIGLKMLNLNPKEHPVVQKISPGMPAEKAGIKDDDEIVSFADIPVFSQKQFIGLVEKRAGIATPIVVNRKGERISVSVTPVLDTANKGKIGVMLGGHSQEKYEIQKPGPTPFKQIAGVWDQMVSTFNALLHSKQTGVRAKDLSGPVGIISGLALKVSDDYRLALEFLVLLNINLAILNLLPIPVLDGGHIMMSIIEAIRRRPISPKFVEYSTTVFAVLLISFMLYVTWADVQRISKIWSLFDRKSNIEKVEPKPVTTETNSSK